MAIGVVASLVDEDFDVQLLSTESGEHGGWSEPEDTADHGRLSSIWLGIGLPVVPSVFYKPMCNDVTSVGLTATRRPHAGALRRRTQRSEETRSCRAPDQSRCGSDVTSSGCGPDERDNGS